MTIRTRFAPSPTGPLHLGHAYAALYADAVARSMQGSFLLRIEDIDRSRARSDWEKTIEEDLHWLGLTWPRPVMRQSERIGAYRKALQSLWTLDLLYPCTCRRKDIEQALSAPQEGAPLSGPDGPVYPGTCRDRPRPRSMPPEAALRLDMRTVAQCNGIIEYTELGEVELKGLVRTDTTSMIEAIGDVVVARRDMGTSYHLSVVVDDAEQGITDVTRGADLADATPIHVLLQRLLGLPTPRYRHHRLIRDETGKRLAKRDDARALATLRAEGWSPAKVLAKIGAEALAIATLQE